MHWIKLAWNNLNQSVFVNCWRHTGLFDVSTPVPQPIPRQDPKTYKALQEDFNTFIEEAGIQSTMLLENFLNPATEDSFSHLELMVEEILEAVQHVDEDEEEEEAEADIASLHL